MDIGAVVLPARAWVVGIFWSAWPGSPDRPQINHATVNTCIMGTSLDTATRFCKTVAAVDDEQCVCYKFGKLPKIDGGIQCEIYLDGHHP